MGLYGERVGALHVLCGDKPTADIVLTHVKSCVRAYYSSPPKHGAALAAAILTDEGLRAEWLAELKEVGERIVKMRGCLKEELIKVGAPGNWDHVTNQIGMFSYTGLSQAQSKSMVDDKHIYMTPDGRISVSGLNSSNVAYVAKSIKEVVEN
jgi:aspartate/tyrosine/aromatic aminotransferase